MKEKMKTKKEGKNKLKEKKGIIDKVRNKIKNFLYLLNIRYNNKAEREDMKKWH
jgi:hypothetical protein